jgi:adenosylhomocysteine nucleosidase
MKTIKRIILTTIILCIFFGGCIKPNEKTTVGILVAVEDEFKPFFELYDFDKTISIENMTFKTKDMKDKRIVLVQTNMGKVNATIATTLLINEFNADYLIMAGTAGAINESLSIGDVVVSKDIFQHDYGMRTDEGLELWEIEINNELSSFYFNADQELKELALSVKPNFNKIEGREIKVVEGRIATADEFITSKEFHNWISKFDVDCVEMEGAAVAQACYKLGKPFLIVRAMSDSTEENAWEIFKRNALKVSKNNALLVSEIVSKI